MTKRVGLLAVATLLIAGVATGTYMYKVGNNTPANLSEAGKHCPYTGAAVTEITQPARQCPVDSKLHTAEKRMGTSTYTLATSATTDSCCADTTAKAVAQASDSCGASDEAKTVTSTTVAQVAK